MKSKRQKALSKRIAQKAKETDIGRAAAPVNSARLNWLNEQLKRAEEIGDTVKQNLIMEEIASLEAAV